MLVIASIGSIDESESILEMGEELSGSMKLTTEAELSHDINI